MHPVVSTEYGPAGPEVVEAEADGSRLVCVEEEARRDTVGPKSHSRQDDAARHVETSQWVAEQAGYWKGMLKQGRRRMETRTEMASTPQGEVAEVHGGVERRAVAGVGQRGLHLPPDLGQQILPRLLHSRRVKAKGVDTEAKMGSAPSMEDRLDAVTVAEAVVAWTSL